MARWGNALGGWRKQKRNGKGQFSGSGGSSKAKAKAKSKAASKAKSKAKVKARRQSGLAAMKARPGEGGYNKPGGYARQRRDMKYSRGEFARTVSLRTGTIRPVGKAGRAYNRISNTGLSLDPYYQGSKVRGKIIGPNKKKVSKKRKAAGNGAAIATGAGVAAGIGAVVLTANVMTIPENRKIIGDHISGAFLKKRGDMLMKMADLQKYSDRAASHGISTFRPAKKSRSGVYNTTSMKGRRKPKNSYRSSGVYSGTIV